MDRAFLSGNRNSAWAETMINLEARSLINTANKVSAGHLNDGLTRIHFMGEIKRLVGEQFAQARKAITDEDRLQCIKVLRAENENLREQDRLLRMRAAQLYAKVEFVRENNQIVGYVISAVHVVVSGLAVIGGALMIATMPPIGALAGAILVIDGINGMSKEFIPRLYDEYHQTEGFFADGVSKAVQYMGFTPETGLAAYKAVTLSASVYGLVGLTRKATSWRLFHSLRHDYYRKVETINRSALTLKIVGYGIKAKVIFDLLDTDKVN
ncbi:DUF4225 domain-containing protein [Paramixta manurensis]|uniref:DUF4225 domain-containing protein n=1 Tax=Paramixta manurensis TaxID=2740817 RepID=A0A6M8UNQ7_9GAMM|nr:DUF4225 domain-containing protein [Erwiniaceae bacterium PD-1]